MMFALYAVAFFCWVSVSLSAPLSCEDLNRPLDTQDLSFLNGRWALVLASLSNPAHLGKLKERDSASISFASHSDSSKLSFTRDFSFNDSCLHVNTNVTVDGSGFIFHEFNYTVKILHTSCSDCAVMRFDRPGKPERVYLFSRRREVGPKELEEFSAQAECLGMTAPFVMDPTKKLCPAAPTAEG
uniref:Apolipoprotein M n=1 Tax=Kryptolebias marmoratus TaxID=37003 RepID=A0A3Q3GQ19_KRYMA